MLLLQQFALSYLNIFSYAKPKPLNMGFNLDDIITFLYFFRAFDMHKIYNDHPVRPDVVAVVGSMSISSSVRYAVPTLFANSAIWGPQSAQLRLAKPENFVQNLKTTALTLKSRTNMVAKTEGIHSCDDKQTAKRSAHTLARFFGNASTYVVSTFSDATISNYLKTFSRDVNNE